MEIYSLRFNNIRNFQSEVEFDFSETGKINTISGKNGSGKTTIFKCILLCQKAFFIHQLLWEHNVPEVTVDMGKELAKYFTDIQSSIEINFKFENQSHASFKIICTTFEKDCVGWSISCIDEHREKIKEFWNIENPSKIIFYIDSNKYFHEEDLSHDNITINTSSSYNNLIIDTILYPERIVSNIYQRLIKDYIGERLVPAKPRRELYFIPTKILLKELLPNINLSNFSAQHFEGQFVLLGKANNHRKVSYYDIRNFSSGEKTLFYILLFINYVGKIGMLIIDEPENHFHEDLLVKFIKMLKEICSEKDYAEYIISKDKKIEKKEKDRKDRKKEISSEATANEIRKKYSDYYLSKVFLLTHSKNLIYNNFANGTNFYVDNAIKKIHFDRYESTLREIGISSIYSKVLFVEGTSDSEFLSLFLNEHNIKIHPLNGCSQVIDTYRKVFNIRDYLRDTHFVFLIDQDTRSDAEIQALRKENEDFFDKFFIVLDRHEFENYLLDENIFKEINEKHSGLYKGLETLSLRDIEKMIFENANKQKESLQKKALKKLNEHSINSLTCELIKKDMPVNSEKAYEEYYSNKLNIIDAGAFLMNCFIENYDKCKQTYSGDNWQKKWRSLCDGKSVLARTIADFCKHLEIESIRLRREIRDIVNEKRCFEINTLIEKIVSRFGK